MRILFIPPPFRRLHVHMTCLFLQLTLPISDVTVSIYMVMLKFYKLVDFTLDKLYYVRCAISEHEDTNSEMCKFEGSLTNIKQLSCKLCIIRRNKVRRLKSWCPSLVGYTIICTHIHTQTYKLTSLYIRIYKVTCLEFWTRWPSIVNNCYGLYWSYVYSKVITYI